MSRAGVRLCARVCAFVCVHVCNPGACVQSWCLRACACMHACKSKHMYARM